MTTHSRRLTTALVLLASLAAPCVHATGEDRPPALDCNRGPLHRTFGATPWLVYACSDARSVVVMSDEGNPAMPFYFILYVKPDGEMKLYGEGTGKQSATQAAFDELEKLTQDDVAALVDEVTRTNQTPDPAG